MKILSIIIALSLMALTGCSDDMITGPEEEPFTVESLESNAAQKVVKLVHIKGTYSGSGTIDPTRTDCPTGSVPISGEGTGIASHLGKIHVSFSHCSFFLVDPANPTYTDGHGELKSANGDTIFGSYNGFLTGPDTFQNVNIVNRGTGRFEDVTGELTETGSVDLTDTGFTFEISIDGFISTVGSSKR
ncbi:hypothetical protein [Rhodohalobacter mucosus]|uniref:Lipoprotein n=1 Tax=Rhodohalobacter mucosus TaxID=2079485 RepID=A0A316TNM1_9BACT|nr:hypothetical protein [Rhodohalobacter mucosus]PWN06000.1 hypothetical protein DDZ15_12535 [Rhodohalobacter mucosus]